MTVVVVTIIVGVGVLVIERLVAVPMMVAFGHVEVGRPSEEDGCDRHQACASSIAEREGDGRADEGSERKQRTRTSRA